MAARDDYPVDTSGEQYETMCDEIDELRATLVKVTEFVRRKAQEEADQASQVGQQFEVRWDGPAGNYWANMGAINHQIAQEVGSMMQRDRNGLKLVTNAIETTASEVVEAEIDDSEGL